VSIRNSATPQVFAQTTELKNSMEATPKLLVLKLHTSLLTLGVLGVSSVFVRFLGVRELQELGLDAALAILKRLRRPIELISRLLEVLAIRARA
jgi:hypothetical protein